MENHENVHLLRMRYLITLFMALAVTLSCESQGQKQAEKMQEKTSKLPMLVESGTTIASRFDAPEGYSRTSEKNNSFAEYLRGFSLKPHGSAVKHYDGTTKRNPVHAAVLDIDTGKRDLQQCADAVMRLRGEYLFAQKDFDNLHFNYTNGFECSYSKWKAGFRPVVNGNNVRWEKRAEPTSSHASFRKYMNSVFAYAGTHSLEKELKDVELSDLKIGDVFIKGGFPGHAVLVVDMAVNANGEKVFLIAQSYMPAQDIHVLKNLNDKSLSPWYSLSAIEETLKTPEWVFDRDQLKRF